MLTRTIPAAAAGLALALPLLAGCTPTAPPVASGGDTGSPVATAEPTTAPEETPTADPTPEPIPAPTFATIWVDSDGLHEQSTTGDLLVGEKVPTNVGIYRLATWDSTYCWANQGAYKPTLGKSKDLWGKKSKLSYATNTKNAQKKGTIASIVITAKAITTPEGIGVGSTKKQIKAAYGGWDETASGFASKAYAIDDGDSRIVFEILNEAADFDGYWGDDPSVIGKTAWVRVEPSGTPLFAIGGGDGGGPCPV